MICEGSALLVLSLHLFMYMYISRFKEELIKELVKNNSAFQCLNKAYQTKINNLEKEYQQLKLQVVKV